MNTHCRMHGLLVLAVLMGATTAFGQGPGISASDINKYKRVPGTIESDYMPHRVDFSGTTDVGPWAKDRKGLKPSVAVVPLGGSDPAPKQLLLKEAEILEGFLLSHREFSVATQKDVSNLMTAAGLSVPSTEAERPKTMNLALSTYDVVVFVKLQKGGWLQVESYHALSKSEAMAHSISMYLGDTSAPGDLDATLKTPVLPRHMAQAIDRALEKELEVDPSDTTKK